MASAKSFVVGGAGSTLTLDDVLRVVQRIHIALDQAAALRVKKESPPPKSFTAEPPQPAPAHDRWLDSAQTRAALFFKLLSLINGKSGVRLAVVEAMEAFLNASILPQLPAADDDETALAALAAALQGQGLAIAGSERQPVAAALAAAGLAASGLSAAERAVVLDGQGVSGGTGALVVQGGKLLLAAANSILALSAEALQADVSALVCLLLCQPAACCPACDAHPMLPLPPPLPACLPACRSRLLTRSRRRPSPTRAPWMQPTSCVAC